MIKKFKREIQLVLIIALLCVVFYPVFFWLDNPKLTQMEVFLELWWYLPIAIVIAILKALVENEY